MCRVLLLCVAFFVFQTFVHAQAIERKIEFQKTYQPAAVVEVPYPQDVVEDAIKEYLAKKGYKTSGYKGFSVCRAIKLDSADTELSDAYFKVEHKDRSQKDVTLVTLLPTKPNEDILVAATNGNPKIEQAKLLLNKLTPYIETHGIDVQMKDQQEVVKKAQKKMDGLMNDQTDLEKRIRNLQSDLDQNKKDQTKQSNVIQSLLASDDDGHKKANKKMNKLMDEQGDLEKKIRKSQTDLEGNKKDQQNQQQELAKQKQVLDAIIAKQKA